ncbi:MAG: autotransporter-associated beta strand repeat-containing protein [Verrucomicrobiota bacterium]
MNPRKNNPFLRNHINHISTFLVAGLIAAGTSAPSARAATLTWDANAAAAGQTDGAPGAFLSWQSPDQWWNGVANVTWTPGDDAVFGNGGAGGVVPTSATTVNSLTFNGFTGTYNVGTNISPLTLTTGLITVNANATNATISSPIVLGADGVFTVNNAIALNGLNLAAPVSGSFSIIKKGLGSLSVSTANSYTGTTTIEDGVIVASNAAALGNSTTPIAVGNVNSITNNLNPFYSVNGGNNLARNITVGANSDATTGTFAIGTGNAGSTATISGLVTLNQNVIVSATNTAGGGGGLNLTGSVTSGSAPARTVTFNNFKQITTSGVIGGGVGPIAVTKINAGTLTFSGAAANTYTGDTTLNAGSTFLNMFNLATPTDLINSASALKMGGSTLTVQGKIGAGVFSSQTFNGTKVNAGTNQVLVNPNNAAGTTVNLGALDTTAPGGILVVGRPAGNTATGTIAINTTTPPAATGTYGARVLFFNGTANTGYDWASTASVGTPYTLSANTAYSPLETGASPDILNSRFTASQTLSGPRVTNSLKIENPDVDQTLDLGANLLTLTNGGLLFTGTNSTIISGAGAPGLTAGNGSGAYELTVHQVSTGVLTVGAAIGNNSSNAVSLLKAGPGQLILTGANTYTGVTTIGSGILQLGDAGETGSLSPSGTIVNNGNLTINRFSEVVQGTDFGTITGTGSFNQAGFGGTTKFTAANTYAGTTTISSGTLQLGNGGATGSIAATSNITNNGNLTINRSNAVVQGTDFGTGAIGGFGSLTQAGSGTTTFTANNTYTGETIINGGTLTLTNGNNPGGALSGTPTITVNSGGILVLMNQDTLGYTVGKEALVINSGGQVLNNSTLAQRNTLANTVTMTGGILGGTSAGDASGLYSFFAGAGNTAVSATSDVSGTTALINASKVALQGANQNFNVTRGVATPAADLTISSQILQLGGNYGFNKTGNGILLLTGLNTYAGGTTVTEGTLTLGTAGTLGATTGALTVNNPNVDTGTAVVLNLATAVDTTVGSLSGTIAIPSSLTNTATINTGGSGRNFTVNQTVAGTFDGVIGGAGSFTLGGLSTAALTLNGVNTYTGDTTVNAGRLRVNGTSIANSGKLVINGGTVEPTGTEVVDTLYFGTAPQAAGTYGATGSGATFIDDLHFFGTAGVVSVTTTGIGPAGYSGWASANAPGQTKDQDHDNDGVKNGIEYFMGLSGSGFTANPALSGGTVTWIKGASYSGTYGTDFVVQSSPDLVTWTNVPEGSGALGTVVIGAGSLSYTPPTGQSKRFGRLVVNN